MLYLQAISLKFFNSQSLIRKILSDERWPHLSTPNEVDVTSQHTALDLIIQIARVAIQASHQYTFNVIHMKTYKNGNQPVTSQPHTIMHESSLLSFVSISHLCSLERQ